MKIQALNEQLISGSNSNYKRCLMIWNDTIFLLNNSNLKSTFVIGQDIKKESNVSQMQLNYLTIEVNNE